MQVQHLVTLARELAAEVETLRLDVNTEGIDFYGEVERYEIKLLTNALKQCKGNQAHAARLLGMKSTTLHSKLKRYGIV